MTGLLKPKRALIVGAFATACSTYEPGLLQSNSSAGGGGQGQGGSAGAAAGIAGDAPVGGTAGGVDTASSGAAGSPEGGEGPAPEMLPYVTGIIGMQSISAGLTLQGTLDWAHWGLTAAGDYNHKAAVASQLLDFKPTGSTSPARLLAGPTTFTWSDGTPTKSASTNDGIKWQGVGEGFQLAVTAGPDVRKLRLYVGVFGGTGALTASLSDPRTIGRGDDRFTSDKASWFLQVVTLEYGNADKPDTRLNVSWRLDTATLPNAAVSLTAIAIGAN